MTIPQMCSAYYNLGGESTPNKILNMFHIIGMGKADGRHPSSHEPQKKLRLLESPERAGGGASFYHTYVLIVWFSFISLFSPQTAIPFSVRERVDGALASVQPGNNSIIHDRPNASPCPSPPPIPSTEEVDSPK